VVRKAIGDVEARKLKRKRGAVGKISILTVLLTDCVVDLLEERPALTVYFLEREFMTKFEAIQKETGRLLPAFVTCQSVESLEALPFASRGGPKNTGIDDDGAIRPPHSRDCILCSRPILDSEGHIVCTRCCRIAHEICVDVHAEEADGMCPYCDELFDCDISISRSSEDSHEIVSHLGNLAIGNCGSEHDESSCSCGRLHEAESQERCAIVINDSSQSSLELEPPTSTSAARKEGANLVGNHEIIDLCSP
jgi:hypothetical protein